VVKKNGLPRRAVILSKFTVVISFKEWSVLEVGAGQSFPREDSFSLGCTLFSARGMVQLGEWLGSTIRDKYSLGQTHSLQISLCLVPEEWPN
jgi:hypothetical protein